MNSFNGLLMAINLYNNHNITHFNVNPNIR